MGAWIEIVFHSAGKRGFFVAPLVGAWIEIFDCFCKEKIRVAPLVGAWIEISGSGSGTGISMSLLSWERGLKYGVC